MQGCGAILQDCDIRSSTGDGIGIEGGAPRVQRCSVHDCARQGEGLAGMGMGLRVSSVEVGV